MNVRTLIPLLFLAGCLSPSAPPPVRYFVPPLSQAAQVEQVADRPIQLLPVTAAGSVESRFSWRLSEVERAFDDLNHWADDPRTFVEGALREALFASGAFAESATGGGNSRELAVHVASFDVERENGRGVAYVRLELRTSSLATLAGAVVGRGEAASADPPALARAMGRALDDAAAKARTWYERVTP